MDSRLMPPFVDIEQAKAKIQRAEDLWNTRTPEKVALAYTEDTVWRNRVTFLQGRTSVREFLEAKWKRELDYKLQKTLWCFDTHRIAVTFQYEWHDDSGNWYRSYGNELWNLCVGRPHAGKDRKHQRSADLRNIAWYDNYHRQSSIENSETRTGFWQ